ncbi:MAG: RsmE family RNA methyltransferase [Verrucomicrobia bacterium]|nr:RsmE family RNA methyltransferase [Verrucomicrobiota bacterium]MDA1087319.1 RsmE family RNA methyltransferase [Verrucomicrobiota bacterium]
MNLILLRDDELLDGGATVILRDDRARHIRRILRSSVGDVLRIGVINGAQGEGAVTTIDDAEVRLSLSFTDEHPDPNPAVHLLCAMPRPQILKHVLRTIGMTGVASLSLVGAERAEKSYFQSPLLRDDRLRAQLLAGMSQGLQTRLPVLSLAGSMQSAVADSVGVRVVAELGASDTFADAIPLDATAVTIALGPEGGWVPSELDLLTRAGFQPVTLGRWNLRVEQAVTAALAQLELVCLQRSR